jgi:hypothetical protein
MDYLANSWVMSANALISGESLRTAQYIAVKNAGGIQIMNGESEAKGAKCGHVAFQRQKVNLRPFYYRIELKA